MSVRGGKPRVWLHGWQTFGDCLKGRVADGPVPTANAITRVTSPIISRHDGPLKSGDEVETNLYVYILGERYRRPARRPARGR